MSIEEYKEEIRKIFMSDSNLMIPFQGYIHLGRNHITGKGEVYHSGSRYKLTPIAKGSKPIANACLTTDGYILINWLV